MTSSRSGLEKLWKHSFFYALAAAGFLLSAAIAAGAGYLLWFRCVREVPPPPDVGPVAAAVRNGDIILRSGTGLWSDLFRSRNARDKRFSHVGIVCTGPDGSCRVLHAEGDDLTGGGTVGYSTLEEFVGQSSLIGISRLRAGNPDLLAEYAASYAGRPFDWKFDKDDESAVYCTELIALALRRMNPAYRLPDVSGIIMPEACANGEYFAEIPLEKQSATPEGRR